MPAMLGVAAVLSFIVAFAVLRILLWRFGTSVLDEPNANLDGDGEMALMRAIEALRKAQRIVVLVSHRPDAVAALNVALVHYEGRMIAFGPREEVFARIARPAKPPTPLKPKTPAGNPSRVAQGVPS